MDLSNSSATFYDGQKAQSHQVDVDITSDAVVIRGKTLDKDLIWDRDSIKVVAPPRDGSKAIISSHSSGFAELHLPNEMYLKLPIKQKKAWFNPRITSLIIAFMLLLGFGLFVALPAASPWIAKNIPESWEQNLGNLVFQAVSEDAKLCNSEEMTRILQTMAASLKDERLKKPVQISIIDNPTPNAMAIPGNHIIIHSSLIEGAKNADEVAGVLAHELGHLAHNHVMEQMVQSIGALYFLDIMTGGGGQVAYFGFELYRTGYSREAEREADDFAAKVLNNNNFSTTGLISFFERIKHIHGEDKVANFIEEKLSWLSTHPMTEDRIHTLKSKPTPKSPSQIISDNNWRALKSLKGCGF